MNTEKNKIEEQVAEQTASQDENKKVNEMTELETLKAENEQLKAENEQLEKRYESEKRSCLRYYRLMNMLKQAVSKLTEEGKITEDDVTRAVLAGQNLTSLEDLLYTLAD